MIFDDKHFAGIYLDRGISLIFAQVSPLSVDSHTETFTSYLASVHMSASRMGPVPT